MTMCKSVLQLDLILWMLVGVYTVHIAMTVLVTALYHVSWERGTSNATQLWDRGSLGYQKVYHGAVLYEPNEAVS